jgi:hypothetical protein
MGIDQATEHLQIQHRVEPKTYQTRIMVESPKLMDLSIAHSRLLEDGVPQDALLSFVQWNVPDTNYYIVATWTDEED